MGDGKMRCFFTLKLFLLYTHKQLLLIGMSSTNQLLGIETFFNITPFCTCRVEVVPDDKVKKLQSLQG